MIWVAAYFVIGLIFGVLMAAYLTVNSVSMRKEEAGTAAGVVIFLMMGGWPIMVILAIIGLILRALGFTAVERTGAPGVGHTEE